MNLFISDNHPSFSIPLHALRGVAALVVFYSHILDKVSKYTTNNFYYLFNGGAAVAFFFVLSGLVIGLSIVQRGNKLNDTANYYIGRFFRIMPLLFATVSLGGLYVFLLEVHMPVKYLEYGDLTLTKFLSGYIGYSIKANPPIWSLFVELVACILLPLLVMTGRNRSFVIGTGLFLLVLACINLNIQHHANFYLINFYVGLSILWWGRRFAEYIAKLPRLLFWMFIGSLFLISYIPRIFWYAFEGDQFGNPLPNLVELAGIFPIVAIVFYCPERFSLLTRRFFKFMGDISYSFYLTHSIALILIINALVFLAPDLFGKPILFTLLMFVVSTPICMGIAYYSYRFIELPGIRAGKRFSKFIHKKWKVWREREEESLVSTGL